MTSYGVALPKLAHCRGVLGAVAQSTPGFFAWSFVNSTACAATPAQAPPETPARGPPSSCGPPAADRTGACQVQTAAAAFLAQVKTKPSLGGGLWGGLL